MDVDRVSFYIPNSPKRWYLHLRDGAARRSGLTWTFSRHLEAGERGHERNRRQSHNARLSTGAREQQVPTSNFTFWYRTSSHAHTQVVSTTYVNTVNFKVEVHTGCNRRIGGLDERGAMRDERRARMGEKGEARDDSNSTLRRHISYAANVRDAEIRDTVRRLTKVEQGSPGPTQQSRRVLRGPHLYIEDRRRWLKVKREKEKDEPKQRSTTSASTTS